VCWPAVDVMLELWQFHATPARASVGPVESRALEIK